MRGGKRAGAGRPPGSGSKQNSPPLTLADGEFLPLDYLLKVVNDPHSSRTQRLRAAEAAAAYTHTKMSGMNSKIPFDATQVPPPVIIVVPRGGQYDETTGLSRYEDGSLAPSPPFVPYTPTSWPKASPIAESKSTVEPPLEVVEVEVENVTPLNPYRKRENEG
jgi:hypothetical protein